MHETPEAFERTGKIAWREPENRISLRGPGYPSGGDAIPMCGGGGGGMTDMLEGLDGAAGVATDKVKALSDSIRQFRGRDKEWINQPSNIAKAFADATKAFEDFELALGNLNTALSPLTGEGGALGQLSTAFGTLFGILTPQNPELRSRYIKCLQRFLILPTL